MLLQLKALALFPSFLLRLLGLFTQASVLAFIMTLANTFCFKIYCK
jgi:hypothetical protein